MMHSYYLALNGKFCVFTSSYTGRGICNIRDFDLEVDAITFANILNGGPVDNGLMNKIKTNNGTRFLMT